MNRMILQAMALCVAAALSAAPALAEKPEGKGNSGKHGKSDRNEQRDDDRGKSHGQDKKEDKKEDKQSGGDRRHFDDRQRTVIVNYYGEQHRAGRCPPGLAKKQNGCMPPGQAKKWQVGRPLPPEVIYYELPRQVVVDLGPPPPRHRYVRVGGDILLLATGTGMVIDALSGLAGM